ncbi:MAG: hypothetical protein K6E38_00025 [Fretibacterium sp.]|nr:hypothetical protein [Fretibacterium sp.]
MDASLPAGLSKDGKCSLAVPKSFVELRIFWTGFAVSLRRMLFRWSILPEAADPVLFFPV